MMRISQRLDYALRVLVLMADMPPGSRVAAGELAERLHLPRRFVEQQVSALARAGLVDCRRGASGGCQLDRPADEITVRDVVVAVQGEVLDIPRQADSATTEVWREASDALSDALGEWTIERLSARQRDIDAAGAHVYFI